MIPTEAERALIDKILDIEPEACISYYHPTVHPGGWRVHRWGQGISKMHEHKIDALTEALKNLQPTTE